MEIISVTKAKKQRGELRLPQLHYIVVDDWIPKLGEKSFTLWLKLHTMVDRTDKNREYDRIKMSNGKLAEKVDVSLPTLYSRLKPLYEYGLIDLIEYEESKLPGGEKPVNVVVYEYPKNEFARATLPLEKLRNWKDRTNEKYNYIKKAGRPKGTTIAKKKQQILDMIESEDSVDLFLRRTIIQNLSIYESLDVDIEELLTWVKKRQNKKSAILIAKELDKLAEWTSPVKNTTACLNYIGSQNEQKESDQNIQARPFPFYNWLED